MPHSLRSKIKSLRYKGIITDKDCERLCKALDNESVLDKIRAEIEQLRPNLRPEQMTDYDYATVDFINDIVAILDNYKAESEVKNEEAKRETVIFCLCGRDG